METTTKTLLDFDNLIEKPAELFWVGRNFKKSDIDIEFHNHGDLFEIIYTGNCSGTVYDDDGAYSFSSNSIVLHNKNTLHKEFYHIEKGISNIYYCNLSSLKLRNHDDLVVCNSHSLVIKLNNSEDKTVNELFSHMIKESETKSFSYGRMLNMQANELLIIILRKMLDNNLINDFSRTNTDISYLIKKEIDDNITNADFSLQSLADKLFISKSYLTKIFKSSFIHTPMDYIAQKRVKLAIEYLLNTTEKIDTIATKIGYNNSLQFIQLFKRRFGKTPTEYRKTNTIFHYE